MPKGVGEKMTPMTDSLGKPSDDITTERVELGPIVSLLDDADVAAAVLDPHAAVLHTNDAFARACGRPTRELTLHPLTKWAIEDDVAGLGSTIGQVADGAVADGVEAEQPGFSTDARLVGADGRVRPLRLHLGRLPGRKTPLLLCVAHDRSEDRRRERSDRSARVAQAAAESTDSETGLPNRKGLESALASASRRSRNNHSPHAFIRCELFVDGDDAAGDPATDTEAIRGCIERIRQRLRPADTVAQLADSVLAVIAEDLHDEQDAAGVAYRLLSTVVEPVPGENELVELRMVIGLAMADGNTPPNALMAASAEAAADARGPGGFVLMDLRGLEDEGS